MTYPQSSSQTKVHYSIPSLIAIACAIGSFFTGAGWGLVLAIIAIVLGAIGVLLSLSPNIRGGIISILSMLIGVIGIIAAIVKVII